jgi:iron complex outermembrane receptor protein
MHANLSYIGKQISFYEMMGAEGYVSRWIDINPYAILRIGATFNYKALELNLNVHNLTNKKYEQGGSSIAPIRQQGLWLMADIAYKF